MEIGCPSGGDNGAEVFWGDCIVAFAVEGRLLTAGEAAGGVSSGWEVLRVKKAENDAFERCLLGLPFAFG